jgi:hypothetical protein
VILLLAIEAFRTGQCLYSFDYILLVVCGTIIGIFPALYTVDEFDRPLSQFIWFGLAAFPTLGFVFYHGDDASSAVCAFFSIALMTGGLASLWLHTAELYPTEVSKVCLR